MPRVRFHPSTSSSITTSTIIEHKINNYVDAFNDDKSEHIESLFDDLYDDDFIFTAIDAGKRVNKSEVKVIHDIMRCHGAKAELRHFRQVDSDSFDIEIAFVKEFETYTIKRLVTVKKDKITKTSDYDVTMKATKGPKIARHPYSNRGKQNGIAMNQIPLDFTPM